MRADMTSTMKVGFHSTVLCALLAAGCGGETADAAADALLDEILPGDGDAEVAASAATAKDICATAVDYLKRNGATTECDEAIVADCAEVVGMLSDPYLQAIHACLAGGDAPGVCTVAVTFDLKPTAAHHELARAYCDECVFGLPGCEDIFYSGDDDQLGLGAVALPFSDAVLREIAEECTQDLTCSVDLPACTQEVLLDHLVPEKTILCLINPLKSE